MTVLVIRKRQDVQHFLSLQTPRRKQYAIKTLRRVQISSKNMHLLPPRIEFPEKNLRRVLSLSATQQLQIYAGRLFPD